MIKTSLRAPAYPLINIDPYTSIWSMSDSLNEDATRFWTGKAYPILGTALIDGVAFRFMGNDNGENAAAMKQTSVNFDSFTTTYTFEAAGLKLSAAFTSPLIPSDNMLSSRPVTYLKLSANSIDGAFHDVKITVKVSSQICFDGKEGAETPAFIREEVKLTEGLQSIKIGAENQKILNRAGDGIGIDWGWFYLTASGDSAVGNCNIDDFSAIFADVKMDTQKNNTALISFAYDDIYALEYFGERLKAYWKQDNDAIESVIISAHSDYDETLKKCRKFDNEMVDRAEKIGGEKYAELLQLALRQIMAAHKLVLDSNGEVLYISKECYSNGCAATVDVSYPSMPFYLIYNPELVKGMMRPILRYASSEAWPHDFAPHDVGTYPLLNGQVYSDGTALHSQMPIEECGNMLIMAAAVSKADGNASFVSEHKALFEKWANYLVKNGVDPENQLCTDDFAGHLAHNCNLSLKAIMGIMGYSIMCSYWGDAKKAQSFKGIAEDMAKTWLETAANGDGSYRLSFDQPNTFSLKYNMIWDKIWETGLFSQEIINAELESYFTHQNKYGVPLDNRADYTKSDWLVWTASLSDSTETFKRFIEPLWLAYNDSTSRVPMADWYFTSTAEKSEFQHRTVQGGFWIPFMIFK